MEKNNSGAMEALIEQYNARTEKGQPELSPEETEKLADGIGSLEELQDGLALLKQTTDIYNACIDNADGRVKTAGEDKKFWSGRLSGLLKVMEKVMDRFVGGKSISADGVKLSVSRRSSIEVDEDWLLSFSRPLADSLQAALPPYVKVRLSIDKNELNAFLRQDNSLLVDNPEKIHSKTSTSTTIK